MERRSSRVAKRRRVQRPVANNNDRISKLPDDLLQMILSRLSTKESVKTSVLATRWKDVWKWRPHLTLDMKNVVRTTATKRVKDVSISLAESLSKVMDNHRGKLESCTIHHYLFQCEDGTLESWIQSATRVKETKDLTLINHIGCTGPNYGYSVLEMAPDTFSHRSLTSLSLCRFKLIGTHGFNSCSNLKILKLVNIIITEVSVLSNVLASCSSLEVLLLQINFIKQHGVLKIENNNLKYLQVSSPNRVDRIEVYAARLDVLDIRFFFGWRDDFILVSPNVSFHRNFWVAGYPHLRYNISDIAEKKRRIWHELMVNDLYEVRRSGCLSVSVDMTNPKQVEILKEVLLMWTDGDMIELEIVFKNNNDAAREEGESSTNGRARRRLWEKPIPFPDADFRVNTVWMYNFSGTNKKEFALASQFVKQKTVIEMLMIETSSFPPMKKLKVQAAVAKLRALCKDDFSIGMF